MACPALLGFQDPPFCHCVMSSDFGMARHMERTANMSKMGTCRWMSPEVLRDSQYSQASDVWRLDIVLKINQFIILVMGRSCWEKSQVFLRCSRLCYCIDHCCFNIKCPHLATESLCGKCLLESYLSVSLRTGLSSTKSQLER